MRALVFSADSKLLAAGGDRGNVRLWDTAGDSSSLALADLPFTVEQFAFAPDGQTLAVAGSTNMAGSLVLWDLLRRQTRASLRLPAGPARAAFAADGKTLATGLADGGVILWDPVTGQERATLPGHNQPIQTLAFTSDGQTLIAVCGDGVVQAWRGGGR